MECMQWLCTHTHTHTGRFLECMHSLCTRINAGFKARQQGQHHWDSEAVGATAVLTLAAAHIFFASFRLAEWLGRELCTSGVVYHTGTTGRTVAVATVAVSRGG